MQNSFFCKTNCSFLCVVLRTLEVITTFAELELNSVFLIASEGLSRGLKVVIKKAKEFSEFQAALSHPRLSTLKPALNKFLASI